MTAVSQLSTLNSQPDPQPSTLNSQPALLRFKRFTPDAKPPKKSHPADAGFDLVGIACQRPPSNEKLFVFKTGIGVEIPEGFVGVLKERSSIRTRGMVLLGGVIDAGYTGPIEACFQWVDDTLNPYKVGERICQLVIVPLIALDGVEEVDELQPLGHRGTNGFGSTGK